MYWVLIRTIVEFGSVFFNIPLFFGRRLSLDQDPMNNFNIDGPSVKYLMLGESRVSSAIAICRDGLLSIDTYVSVNIC